MSMNPFGQPEAPAWLAEDPIPRIPRLLERLLELAEHVPDLLTRLPWLNEVSVWGLIQERMAQGMFPDTPSSPQEERITTFFASVTQPVAEVIEHLYVSPLLQRISTVKEIMYRMACSVGVPPLPLDVVTGVCCSFWYRRSSVLSENLIQRHDMTWLLGWQEVPCKVRSAQGTRSSFLLLVTDQTTGKVLAFRSTFVPPERGDLLFTLYDALVFSSHDRWHLHLPARISVQHPLPPELIQAGKAWNIEVEEVVRHEFAFLQQWEGVLEDRVVDAVQYLRILDRACERAFGYAPFLTKQQAIRKAGRRMRREDDPCWFIPALRELLPAYEARVDSNGAIKWDGLHYRDMESDVLRYWSNEHVSIRPSPTSEAVVWVYWDQEILCQALAEELCHSDGSYRPYWFPYPRLGE